MKVHDAIHRIEQDGEWIRCFQTSLAQIARHAPIHQVVVLQSEIRTRSHREKMVERENAFPPDVLEMDNLEAIKRAVEVGFGVSITPRSAVQRELQAGTLSVVPLDAVDAQITSSWAQYSRRKLSAPARVFVDVLEQVAVSC